MKKRIFIFLFALSVLFSSCGTERPGQAVHPIEGEFFVQFIDVGQADSALICSGEKTMLIDGGNTDDSSRIVACLKNNKIEYLDYVVCTHADEDHVGGLSGALSAVQAGCVYAPYTEADTRSYRNFKEKVQEQGLEVQHPSAGSEFELGESTVRVLAPFTEEVEDRNNTSIVLKVLYGETSFLFTGDAEREEEQDMLNSGYDLSADVLKVGHHGSRSSTTYPFLREVMPHFAVISVGADNSYGHPTEETLSRLRDAGVTVFRTDLQGDIVAVSDGTSISMTPSRGERAGTMVWNTKDREKQSTAEQELIGNKKSKIVHLPSCTSLPQQQNRVIFSSLEEAEEVGYSLCRSCFGY